MTDHSLPSAIFLMGPTASGKTDLAVTLVELLPCEIISVDSAMVYRGMDIGSAKPDAETLARAPHRLIDIVDPSEPYSAARFCREALQAMAEITARGKIPLLVGGTMLYFKALEFGLSKLPDADATVRAELSAQMESEGLEALHAELSRVDPIAAERIHRNDPQRILRALEVWRLTGRPLTELQQEAEGEVLPYRLLKLCLCPEDRAVLHQRIALRFEQMLAQGFVDEVRMLKARGDLNLELPSMKSIGYRQVWEYLDGQLSYEEMAERGVIVTRQFAKRQITWLRSYPGVRCVDPTNMQLDQLLEEVRAWI